MLVFSDHIGMPMIAVDGTGNQVWEGHAEPYGQLRGTVNAATDPELRYPGQWQDELRLDALSCDGDMCTMRTPGKWGLSLFENGYRWYRPEWGRYTQSDPVRSADDLFAYAKSNPLTLVDEFGLFAIAASCDCISEEYKCQLKKTIEAARIIALMDLAPISCLSEFDQSVIHCGRGTCDGGKYGASPPGGHGTYFRLCGLAFEEGFEQTLITFIHEWHHQRGCGIENHDQADENAKKAVANYMFRFPNYSDWTGNCQ